MDVFRIEGHAGQWALLKAHGYKVILTADSQAVLIDHVLSLTRGEGAVIRFPTDTGARELRVGLFDEDSSID